MELLSFLGTLVWLYRHDDADGGWPGQGLVEYALIVTLVGIAVVAALTLLGSNVTSAFSRISASLSVVPTAVP